MLQIKIVVELLRAHLVFFNNFNYNKSILASNQILQK